MSEHDPNREYKRILALSHKSATEKVRRTHISGCLVERGRACDCGHEKLKRDDLK